MPRMSKLLICSSGLPGSGKSVILEAAKKMGIPTVVMGDVVRTETRKHSLPSNAAHTAKIMLEYREKYGKEVFARLVSKEIEVIEGDVVLVDGVRNPEELEYFQSKEWRVATVAILSPPELRFERLRKRGRIDEVADRKEFLERDQREISVGMDRVILHADYYLVNQYLDMERAVAEAEKIIKKILENTAK
ncbi:MAG: AAA family ATPase [Nitrososphaeria archaeon]|nr:AAA family ATPase [Nitrososphaeria archaeon]NIQ33866.1 AAA family ATPase [Nitrososphaeria archaeon]